MPRKKGGALKADQIQKVLENTYKETDDAPDGYTFDKDLSDDRVKVYKDMNSDQVIVAHRGSKGFRDWLDNARYAYSGDIRTSGTYQDAKSRQKKAIDKYGAQNIISVGHSRAGKYVEELNKEQPVKEVITYNKAVHPNTIFQSNPENQTDVRTSTDVVSALSPFQFSKNQTVTIPGGFDLLKAHKPSALSYLGNKLIGKGYKQMRVGDMRKFVKAYKREKYGEKMTGGARLGKKELVSMMNPILEDDDLDEMVGGSVWTDFVKEFSARHGLRYGCALSKYKDPLKKAYKLKKEGKDWVEDLVIDQVDKGANTQKIVKFEPMEEATMDTSPKPKNIIVKPAEPKPDAKFTRKPVKEWIRDRRNELRELSTEDLYKTLLNLGLYIDFEKTTKLPTNLTEKEDEDVRRTCINDIINEEGMQLYGDFEPIRTKIEVYPKRKAKGSKLTDRKSKPIIPRADDIDLDEEGTLKERVKARKENEMVDMEYKPKMTREMRFQMEKALRESTKHLPPLRSKREDELIAQQVPALKGILKGLKEKTTGLKRQDIIDLILKREGLVKGAVFDDFNDYKRLEEQYKIRRDSSFLLDGLTLTNVRVLLSRLRNDLKEAKKAGDSRKIGNAKTDIDRYTKELKQLEQLTKDDQYLIKKYNKLKGGMVGGNRWTDFVKDYAKKENTTYMCASSNPKTKEAYKLFKEAKPRQKKEVAFVPLEEVFPTEIIQKKITIQKPKPIPAPVNIKPVVSRIEEKVKELEKLGREKGATAYDSNVLMLSVAFVQLMKKYSSKCIVVNVNKVSVYVNVGVDLNINPKLTAIIPERLGKSLKKCLDNGADMIVIPLGLEWNNLPTGHANMLIYRPLQKQVERFEPHGREYRTNSADDKSINDQLKQLFEVDLKPFIGEVRYREPVTICPSVDGFQNLESSVKGLKEEGGGFCGLWSIFLAEMTMLNPEKSTKEIIDEVLDITKREPAYLKSLIRGYVRQVETGLDELIKTLGKPGFKYRDKKSSNAIYRLKTKLNEWLLETMFEVPDPALIQSYKDKLKFLSKKEVNEIYDIYSQNRCIKKVDACINNIVDLLAKGVLYPFGATGLKDIDVILRDRLYDREVRRLSPEFKYTLYGLAMKGYFSMK